MTEATAEALPKEAREVIQDLIRINSGEHDDRRKVLDRAMRVLAGEVHRNRDRMQQQTLVEARAPIEFWCPVPQAKKNRGKIIRVGKHAKYIPNPEATKQEDAIREFLLRKFEGLTPYFGKRDVEVEMTHHAKTRRFHVLVRDAGPCPKEFAGRAAGDLPNLCEVPCDAMQGRAGKRKRPAPIYMNDNQIVGLTMRRVLE